MIKFFTDILGTIPNKDKIKALSFLLLAFVIVRIAPEILSSLNNSCKNLELKSIRDEKEILLLDSTITKEKIRYLKAQDEFTEYTTKKEGEYLAMLDSLATKLSKMKMYERLANQKIVMENSLAYTKSEDTVVTLYQELETKPKFINRSSIMIDEITNDIKNMKKSINKKDILNK